MSNEQDRARTPSGSLYKALLDLLMVVGDEPNAMFEGHRLNGAFIKASDALREHENFAASEIATHQRPRSSEGGGRTAHDHEHRLSKSEVAGANPAEDTTSPPDKSGLVSRLRLTANDEGMTIKVISGDHQDVAPAALLREAADAIAASATQAWIPVSKQLPENTDALKVLAFAPEVDMEDGVRVWIAVAGALNIDSWRERYGVTHWMPIPASPDRESNRG